MRRPPLGTVAVDGVDALADLALALDLRGPHAAHVPDLHGAVVRAREQAVVRGRVGVEGDDGVLVAAQGHDGDLGRRGARVHERDVPRRGARCEEVERGEGGEGE